MSQRIRVRIEKEDHLSPAHTWITDADTGEQLDDVKAYSIVADVDYGEVRATLTRYERPVTVELKTYEQEVEVSHLETDAITSDA